MHMQVVHLLPTFRTGVDHDAKTAIGIRVAALFGRQTRRQRHDAPQQTFVLGPGLRHRRDMRFRHDQEVHRRPRVNVVKDEDVVVLVHLVGRDLSRNDLAENAIGIVRMGGRKFSGVQEAAVGFTGT